MWCLFAIKCILKNIMSNKTGFNPDKLVWKTIFLLFSFSDFVNSDHVSVQLPDDYDENILPWHCVFVPPYSNCYVLNCLPPTPCRIGSPCKRPRNCASLFSFCSTLSILVKRIENAAEHHQVPHLDRGRFYCRPGVSVWHFLDYFWCRKVQKKERHKGFNE